VPALGGLVPASDLYMCVARRIASVSCASPNVLLTVALAPPMQAHVGVEPRSARKERPGQQDLFLCGALETFYRFCKTELGRLPVAECDHGAIPHGLHGGAWGAPGPKKTLYHQVLPNIMMWPGIKVGASLCKGTRMGSFWAATKIVKCINLGLGVEPSWHCPSTFETYCGRF